MKKTAEEILEPYRLYILQKVLGEQGKVEKVSWNGALKAMQEYASQFTPPDMSCPHCDISPVMCKSCGEKIIS